MLNSTQSVKTYAGSGIKGELISASLLDVWLQKGNDPRELLTGQSRIAKHDKYGCAGFVDVHQTQKDSSEFFVKKYLQHRIWRVLYYAISRNRALTNWRNSLLMRERDIPVPDPFGFFIYGPGNDIGTSFFCCESLKGCHNLHALARDNRSRFNELVGDGIYTNLADLVATLHSRGFTHGDLKWANILLDDKNGKVWIIDLDGSKTFDKKPHIHYSTRDIARFLVSPIELNLGWDVVRLLFQTYRAKYPVVPAQVAPIIYKILRRKGNDITCQTILDHLN